ncbi:MAG TPA: hypothetical protein VFQ45_06505 [Longimicrobium sp.]|nr:hypothetical protein [Longimicrobium sp.]
MNAFLFTVIITAICGWAIAYLSEEKQYDLLWIPFIVFAVGQIGAHLVHNRRRPVARAVLWLLHDAAGFSASDRVRITLLKLDIRKRYRQVARFSLTSPALTDHPFPLDKGVAGQAYRLRAPVFLSVGASFHQSIIADLGFTEDEARSFIQKAEYFCIPFFDADRKMQYMLSVDSDIPGVITADRQETLKHLAPAATAFLLHRTRDQDLVQLSGANHPGIV